MKKLLVAFASLVWAGFAVAGEYHVNDTLKCSQCHTMHAARSHGFNAGTADSLYPVTAQGTGHEFLLTFPTINQTCLACHDGNAFIPDVLGATPGAANRSGGALNLVPGTQGGHTAGNAADAAATPYAEWMGHTLGLTNWVAPGQDTATATATEFGCNNCHGVHGRASYRNLSAASTVAGVVSVISFTNAAAIDPTYDVTVLAEGSTRTQDIKFAMGAGRTSFRGVPTPPVAGMNGHCARCHGKFHGATGDAATGITDATGNVVRHPVADAAGGMVDFAASNLIGGAQTDLVRPLWVAGLASFQVGCLTCHKGHGNARGFGLLYPGPVTEGTTYTGTTNQATQPGNAAILDYEQGDAAIQNPGESYAAYPIRNLCATCHRQSRSRLTEIPGTP